LNACTGEPSYNSTAPESLVPIADFGKALSNSKSSPPGSALPKAWVEAGTIQLPFDADVNQLLSEHLLRTVPVRPRKRHCSQKDGGRVFPCLLN
jgi:hypothetical protein